MLAKAIRVAEIDMEYAWNSGRCSEFVMLGRWLETICLTLRASSIRGAVPGDERIRT